MVKRTFKGPITAPYLAWPGLVWLGLVRFGLILFEKYNLGNYFPKKLSEVGLGLRVWAHTWSD